MLRKGGREEPGTPEEEREALRRQRLEGAQELERLKRELAERVAAVRQREQELEDALGRAGTGRLAPLRPPSVGHASEQDLATRASALERRERELAARERAFAEASRDPDEERLAHIEARLAELREAEQLFLRTQQDLAGRSEALTARERLVAELEREVGASREDWGGHELAELERRLRKLETERSGVPETTQTVSGGFSRMRRTRPTSTSSARSPLPPLEP